jgi:hypothetical protein
MDKTAVIKILARFHKEIEARGIRPLKVILYGSGGVKSPSLFFIALEGKKRSSLHS